MLLVVLLMVAGSLEGGRRKRQLGLLGFGYLGYSRCSGGVAHRFHGNLCKHRPDPRHQDQQASTFQLKR